MIKPLKRYALFCFLVCLIFLIEQIYEWVYGRATSASILTFLGILFGGGTAFIWKYSEAIIDEDNDGKIDNLRRKKEEK